MASVLPRRWLLVALACLGMAAPALAAGAPGREQEHGSHGSATGERPSPPDRVVAAGFTGVHAVFNGNYSIDPKKSSGRPVYHKEDTGQFIEIGCADHHWFLATWYRWAVANETGCSDPTQVSAWNVGVGEDVTSGGKPDAAVSVKAAPPRQAAPSERPRPRLNLPDRVVVAGFTGAAAPYNGYYSRTHDKHDKQMWGQESYTKEGTSGNFFIFINEDHNWMISSPGPLPGWVLGGEASSDPTKVSTWKVMAESGWHRVAAASVKAAGPRQPTALRVEVAGLTGTNEQYNGYYSATDEKSGDHPVYVKEGTDKVFLYQDFAHEWRIGDTVGVCDGWVSAADVGGVDPTQVLQWEVEVHRNGLWYSHHIDESVTVRAAPPKGAQASRLYAGAAAELLSGSRWPGATAPVAAALLALAVLAAALLSLVAGLRRRAGRGPPAAPGAAAAMLACDEEVGE